MLAINANQKQPPQTKEYLEKSECRDSLSAFLTEAYLLTDELLELQEVNVPPSTIKPSLNITLQRILTTNNLTKPTSRKRRKLDTESSIDTFHQLFIDATEDVTALEQK